MPTPNAINIGYSFASIIQCPVCQTITENVAPLFSGFIIYTCATDTCSMVDCQIVVEKVTMMVVGMEPSRGYGT